MSYTNAEGRTQILEETAAAIGQLGIALAELAEAYEHLDEALADRMEQDLHRPVQSAYGQLKRSNAEFARRAELTEPPIPESNRPAPENPRVALENAADAVQSAEDMLAELQDTLLPVEVGDQELRAGLSAVRTLIARLPAACDELVRSVGR
jgi:ABC-type transporter Mla subunit MlaD